MSSPNLINAIASLSPGADYAYCKLSNELLEMEWEGGDLELTKEEYREGLFLHSQLHPRTGGHAYAHWVSSWRGLYGGLR